MSPFRHSCSGVDILQFPVAVANGRCSVECLPGW